MKTFIAFLFLLTAVVSIAQQRPAPVDTIARDTIKINLAPSGSFSRLQNLDAAREKLKVEYLLLEEKLKGLNLTYEEVLLGEMRQANGLKDHVLIRYVQSGPILYVLVEKKKVIVKRK